MTPSPSPLADEIYKLLYKESTVDGARILHEDRWPIERLLSLFEKYMDEIINTPLYSGDGDPKVDEQIDDSIEMAFVRQEQRKALSKLLGK